MDKLHIESTGAITSYQYDAEGHVLLSIAFANRLVNYNPQRLLSMNDIQLKASHQDRAVYYYYDQLGRLQAEINGEGFAKSYRYNTMGQLVEVCKYYNVVSQQLSGDWLTDKPTSDKRRDVHIYTLYDGRGLKIAEIDGEGYLIEYRYSESGLLKESCAYEKAIHVALLNEHTTIEQIRPQSMNNDHHTYYKYNDLGLLVEEKTQNGKVITYAYDEVGNRVSKTVSDYKIHQSRQQCYRYDGLGRIIQSLDEAGSRLVNQDGLSEEEIEVIWQKHGIHFEYDNTGLLRSQTNALHQTTRYFYDEFARLRYTVQDDGAVVETYFNSFNQIEFTRKYSSYLKLNQQHDTTERIKVSLDLIKNDQQDEVIRYEYNSAGQLERKYIGNSGLEINSYNAFGEISHTIQKIDSQNNKVKNFDYDRRGFLTSTVDDSDGAAIKEFIHYDAYGRVIKKVDGRNNSISFLYNKKDEQILFTNANNKSKRVGYDAFGRVLWETDYTTSKPIKEFVYDDINNSFILTHSQENIQVITQFNAFGDKIAVMDGNGYKTSFYYDEKGQLTRVDTPENGFQEYYYDSLGHLIIQQDAGGHIIHYQYDAQGHVLSKIEDPDGLKITTIYQYDALGRQLQITDANGFIKRFTYDDKGHLIESCVDPNGLNLVTKYSYDDRGLLIRETVINPLGKNKTTVYQWDHLGRKIATIIDPEGLQITTSYQYDDNGNLICVTDANRHDTRYVYDGNNQCLYQINARGVLTEYTYDINGNQIETVTYARAIPRLSEYNESSIKSVLIEDPVHDQYQFREYDAAGRVVAEYDALGFVTTYRYDGNGNLVYSCHYAKAVTMNELKKGSRPLPTLEGARQQYFVYDALNHLRFQCNQYGRVIESCYDANGQLLSVTKYGETISVSGKNDLTLQEIKGQLKPDRKLDQTTRYSYDQAGRLCLEISPQGVAKSYQYDKLGHVLASTVHATLVASDGNVSVFTAPVSTKDRTNHFVYDAAGRELYRVSSEGRVLERRYDAAGNVIKEFKHSELIKLAHFTEESIKRAFENMADSVRATSFEYDTAGRLISQTNPQQTSVQYSYDNSGNVLRKTEANQAVWTYHYDEVNQLIETISPAILVTSSAGQERRSIITRNVYDNFGNLISVIHDAEGIKQTVFYEFDNKNCKIKTIYPEVKVNKTGTSASLQRQETIKTLYEEVKYNAFGESIAAIDKAGNWKHFAYDDQGLLIYSVDNQGGLTQYSYDTFGRVACKTVYAQAIYLEKEGDYSVAYINKACQVSRYDRHEFYKYNLDDQVIEVSRDAVRMFNPKTGHYDVSLKPTTRTIYNSFGEIIKASVKMNESEWADTLTYYDKDGHKTAVIDAEGYLTAYTYDAFGEMDSMIEYAQVCNEWDDNRYVNPQTSDKDRVVVFTYDVLGQMTGKTLKAVSFERKKNKGIAFETVKGDLTTQYSYDALGNLTAVVDAKGNTSYCYYDELGQLIAKVGPKIKETRSATTYSYDALGHLVETRRWAQGAIEADEQGFTLRGASGKDITTHQEYDDYGHLIAEIDGLNHAIYYSYDENGNLARSWRALTQPDKSFVIQDKRYRYDKENHLIQTATFKNNGQVKTEDVQYNVFGELIAKGVDGLLNAHVEYDRLGRIWRCNTQGYYQIYVYDLMDHVTQIVTSTDNFRGNYGEKGVDLSESWFETAVSYDKDTWKYDLQRQNNTYNALGHLIRQTKEFTVDSANQSGNVCLQYCTQSQTVDRWGNRLSFINAQGYQTHYEYNAFNEVIKQELPEVYIVDEHGVGRYLKPINRYAYDELGQAIAMMDANGHMVSKEYDAMGRVIKEVDAKGNQRTKHYNLLDQMDCSTNELGGITTYTYDKMNRLVSINTPKTHQEYVYDEVGQLIKQKNGEKEETAFWYDTLGNQIQREDARGYKTFYEYNDFGHKTKETDASGRSQSWSYDDQGKLLQHTDLGKHTTTYQYNTNGKLLEESSTSGKQIKYYYRGDGDLIQYADEARHEVVNYFYDESGQLLGKESGRNDTVKDGWLRETDYYQYDALGRLIQVRRRNPEDMDKRFPDKDHALLSIDYEYDAVGNIRHTKVVANYTGYERVESDDYYLYDENNRMIVNKGQLVHGDIVMSANKGSTMIYDAAGNIKEAAKYENGQITNYRYQYNQDSQLELVQKGNISLQAKTYDAAGRVIQENLFDTLGNVAQKNITTYEHGLLVAQSSLNGKDREISKTIYAYDAVGNMTDLNMKVSQQSSAPGYELAHHYSYALWDGYQQNIDDAKLTIDKQPTTYGRSTRSFDVNGMLTDAIDAQTDNSGKSNTTHYLNSSAEGIKARIDKEGQTTYLTIAGKTIGDLRLNRQGKQYLNVYGGFTPTGSQEKATPAAHYMWRREKKLETGAAYLGRGNEETSKEILPESTQDNLGAYTLQSGDTLESIALQIYGDSSLWYLIADANGISDRNAQASNNGPLHIGQRINIPLVATGQHQTYATHKVLNADQVIGNTTATTLLPPSPPPLPTKHHGLFAKIVVAIVAVVATVLTAGIIGAIAGVAEGISSLFSIGTSVLGGGVIPTMSGTLAAGFTAGFVGNIASQGIAKAMGVQNGIDIKGALISGLATAATAGMTRGLSNSNAYQDLMSSVENLPITKAFSIKTAAEMMEQNAASQGLNVALRKHQHFDWEELGLVGVTAGLMGGSTGRKLEHTLRKVDLNTGILSSELRALTTAGAAITTGQHFNVEDVITSNLGSAIGSAIINSTNPQETLELSSENPLPDELYLTDTLLNITHPERTLDIVYQNYLAQQLSGSGGYEGLDNELVGGGNESNQQSNFELLQNRIFDHEGGISNHKNDRGGYTNKGITWDTFKKFAKTDLGIEPTIENLKNLTNEQASVIYKKRFWDPIRADEINSISIAYALYDFHVNAPSQAVKLLQKSINMLGGNLVVDNIMGSKTIKAINNITAHKLFDIYQKEKINFYTRVANSRSNQLEFLNGWLNRVNSIKFES
ncbi:hypothetical protein EP47_11685 [Legionella norrlandica]|uniref:LysM domain-containing protein n=2 Tax=Legionella norrlandica TaxID=1498499 RepID=A0A0A2SXI4_9GAMM|nr:hypothetical protein EP47_11685 [Legionella norrlandica]